MIINEQSSNFTLLLAIKQKKIEMILLGEQHGLLHQQTIRCSQELDDLLNRHLSNSLTQKSENVG